VTDELASVKAIGKQPAEIAAGLKRDIVLRPGYNHGSKGVHGVDLCFYLTGQLGVIQFIVYTNWMTPEVQADYDARTPNPRSPYTFHQPIAADIGYHSPKPMYEGQTSMQGDCKLIGGRTCYYDGSSLGAEKVMDVLRREGSEGVWSYMENEYRERFEP
jgi:hypothetical protein